jgi:uncharacterized protein (DUF2252 family)
LINGVDIRGLRDQNKSVRVVIRHNPTGDEELKHIIDHILMNYSPIALIKEGTNTIRARGTVLIKAKNSILQFLTRR